MPSKAIAFGEFSPDLAPSNSYHLSVAKNTRSIANGYGPVGSFQSISTGIGAAFVGGSSFIGSDGNSTLLSATPAKLRKFSGSWSDILNVSTSGRWNFAQFGDNIIYANGGQLGSYGLLSGTAADISGAPSNAIDVATVRDFVMCLTADSQVVWSGFNNSSEWTSGTDQSDFQPLLDGGTGVRIIGGQYAIVLQKDAIRRVSYTGDPTTVFQFDVISPEVGCMAAGSVCSTGRIIFFLSERGFELCDGDTVTPISDSKLSTWFFSTYSRPDISNIWSAIDPRRNEAWWVLPGNPGIALVYNWMLKQWFTVEADLSAVFSGRTNSISIDDLDLTYGDLDSIPISLDDPSLQGGNPILLAVDNSGSLGAFTGTPMQADIQLKNIELSPGKRSRIRRLRPATDALDASVTLDARMRAGDAEGLVSAASMRTNGSMPIRANGRYINLALTIPAGTAWSYVQGCEYEFEVGDGR